MTIFDTEVETKSLSYGTSEKVLMRTLDLKILIFELNAEGAESSIIRRLFDSESSI